MTPLEVARVAVTRASLVCRSVTVGPDIALHKADASPVTVADFAAQAVVVHTLRERLGPVSIVGEERADALREPGAAMLRAAVVEAARVAWLDATEDAVLDAIDAASGPASSESSSDYSSDYWALDPIDGTKGFLRGDHYAVCLARVERGRPTIATMACPRYDGGLRFDAAGGVAHEARLDGGPPRALAGPPRPHARLRIAHSVEGGHTRLEDIGRVLDSLGVAYERVPMDSQAKYGAVARGDVSAYLRLPRDGARREPVWDHAAGDAIASAAGCSVTDLTGAPFDFGAGDRLVHNFGVVCSHPDHHAALVDAIARLGLDAR